MSEGIGNNDRPQEITIDDLDSDNLADHPRERVRIRPRKSRGEWDINKIKKDRAPIPTQVEANLTAMAEMLKQMGEEIIKLRQEANIATAKADTAIRDATEVAQKTMQAGLSQVNESIDKAVQARGQEIAQVLIDRLANAQGQAPPQTLQTPVVPPTNGNVPVTPSGPNLFEGILAQLAMKEMGIGQAQNPFAQLTQAAQSMGQFYTALMEPLSRMQQDVRRTTLQELIALDRTGGSLPWHEGGPKPADTPKVANLNQAAADILAGKCRLR